MNSKAENIKNYSFTSSDHLLLDTNIWLYIEGPQIPSGNRQVAVYTEAYRKILEGKSAIYLDVLIMSEFINSYARMEWKNRASDIKYFKDFRRTAAFKPVAKSIAAAVKRILRYSSRVESRFETLDINELLQEYAIGEADFNDQILATLCKQQGFKLITHDGDFRGQEISILTANNRLLS